MKKLVRMICLLLTFVLVVGSTATINVLADVTVENKENPKKELSGITIASMALPVPGAALPSSAMITSDQGVSWEVPVIWADETGKKAVVAEAGKRYFPTLLFYVPGGYKIAGVDASGRFSIRVSAALAPYFNSDSLVFMVDPSTQIVYVVYAPGLSVVAPAGAGTAAATPGNAVSDKSGGSEEPPKDERSATVRMYCDDSAIQMYDDAFLEMLIDFIKNVAQPQATNLLRDAFPKSFGSAVTGEELSSQMGLFIYYKKGSIDGSTTPDDALAYVEGFYDKDNKYRMYMGVDTDEFVVYKDGKWVIAEDQQSSFDNTILHEMMHAFMYDYTRFGMYSTTKEAAFPNWFTEGSATAVQNAYQFRYSNFMGLQVADDAGNYLGSYTNDSIKNAYTYNGNKYDLSHCDDKDNVDSAYALGSLATVYLGYMAAKEITGTDPITTDAAGNVTNVDMIAIKNGLDEVLFYLHDRSDGGIPNTLDTIIKWASSDRYNTTDEYQAAFIKGANEANDGGSLDFATKYLTWLEAQSYTNESGKEIKGNGSILRQDQKFEDPINTEQKTVAGIYAIADERGAVVSSVNDDAANRTGGKSEYGTGYPAHPDDQAAAAATAAEAPADTTVKEANAATVTETPAEAISEGQGAVSVEDLMSVMILPENGTPTESAVTTAPEAAVTSETAVTPEATETPEVTETPQIPAGNVQKAAPVVETPAAQESTAPATVETTQETTEETGDPATTGEGE